MNETRIAPTQTRVVPVRITQNASVAFRQLSLDLYLVSGGASETLRVTLPVVRHALWNAIVYPTDGIKASYFFAAAMSTAFIVKPPQEPNSGEPRPPILALRKLAFTLRSLHLLTAVVYRWCWGRYHIDAVLDTGSSSSASQLDDCAYRPYCLGMLVAVRLHCIMNKDDSTGFRLA